MLQRIAMERSAWTDERLDDFAAAVRDELRLVRTEMRELRTEMREMRTEMHADILALQRQLTQIGWGLATALVAAVVAMIVAVA